MSQRAVDETPPPSPSSAPVRRPYERPQVMWRESYQPVSFGLSCAKLPGQPGCAPQKS
jgi:hypothetical protein